MHSFISMYSCFLVSARLAAQTGRYRKNTTHGNCFGQNHNEQNLKRELVLVKFPVPSLEQWGIAKPIGFSYNSLLFTILPGTFLRPILQTGDDEAFLWTLANKASMARNMRLDGLIIFNLLSTSAELFLIHIRM